MPLKKKCRLPVCFQWAFSGLPMVFQSTSFLVMQLTTGLPPECHWLLALASVVLVASQCTCGSNDPPVRFSYANELINATGRRLGDVNQCGSSVACLVVSQCTDSICFGSEVSRSGHFSAFHPLCIQLVWRELFEVGLFHLNCNPKTQKLLWCS